MSKVTNMTAAISEHVNSGDFLFIGGYICRPPTAAIHEIIRQGIRLVPPVLFGKPNAYLNDIIRLSCEIGRCRQEIVGAFLLK